jgi:hypothetical protein
MTLSDNPSFSLDLDEQLVASCHEIDESHYRETNLENPHEILQWATLGIVGAVNAKGASLEDYL